MRKLKVKEIYAITLSATQSVDQTTDALDMEPGIQFEFR